MELPAASERVLIDSAGQGDGTAIDRLLTQQLPALRAFVHARLQPDLRARVSGSDIVQSVCRELIEKLSGFDYRGPGPFRAWLFTAALNRIRMVARHHDAAKRARGREVHLDTMESELLRQHGLAASLSPSGAAIALEEAQRVQSAFDALPEEHREVISLVRIGGLSHAEAAEHLGRNEVAVRQLLHRALARLASELQRTRSHGG